MLDRSVSPLIPTQLQIDIDEHFQPVHRCLQSKLPYLNSLTKSSIMDRSLDETIAERQVHLPSQFMTESILMAVKRGQTRSRRAPPPPRGRDYDYPRDGVRKVVLLFLKIALVDLISCPGPNHLFPPLRPPVLAVRLIAASSRSDESPPSRSGAL